MSTTDGTNSEPLRVPLSDQLEPTGAYRHFGGMCWAVPGERFGLKDLDPSAGRHDEPMPACSFFCELAEQEYSA